LGRKTLHIKGIRHSSYSTQYTIHVATAHTRYLDSALLCSSRSTNMHIFTVYCCYQNSTLPSPTSNSTDSTKLMHIFF
jgi:hypothetical protein